MLCRANLVDSIYTPLTEQGQPAKLATWGVTKIPKAPPSNVEEDLDDPPVIYVRTQTFTLTCVASPSLAI